LGAIEDEQVQKKLIDETVEKFGQLDVLVNNAGLSNITNSDPSTLENLDHVFKVNVRSLLVLTRLAIPALEKTKGNVVNVSSVGGQRTAPVFTPYCLSKSAVDHFTRNAAVQYAPKGIRVNTVSPGFAKTNICEHYGEC
jgi:NAD(P)-dependent dehydrogenase (short-subunit alcohol dehydrogenase family)